MLLLWILVLVVGIAYLAHRRTAPLPALGIIGIVGLALVAIVFFYWLSRRVRVRAPAPAS